MNDGTDLGAIQSGSSLPFSLASLSSLSNLPPLILLAIFMNEHRKLREMFEEPRIQKLIYTTFSTVLLRLRSAPIPPFSPFDYNFDL